MMDPYQPPLIDNKFYTKHVGIPINVPTQTVDANYGSMGVLTRMSGKEQILPLYGRPLHFGRGKFNYYAGSIKTIILNCQFPNQDEAALENTGATSFLMEIPFMWKV